MTEGAPGPRRYVLDRGRQVALENSRNGGGGHHAIELLRRAGHDATRQATSGRPVPDGHGVNTAHTGWTTSTPQIRPHDRTATGTGDTPSPGPAGTVPPRQCRQWALDNGDVANGDRYGAGCPGGRPIIRRGCRPHGHSRAPAIDAHTTRRLAPRWQWQVPRPPIAPSVIPQAEAPLECPELADLEPKQTAPRISRTSLDPQ